MSTKKELRLEQKRKEDIEYYDNYKKSLCQFIIINSCYVRMANIMVEYI